MSIHEKVFEISRAYMNGECTYTEYRNRLVLLIVDADEASLTELGKILAG